MTDRSRHVMSRYAAVLALGLVIVGVGCGEDEDDRDLEPDAADVGDVAPDAADAGLDVEVGTDADDEMDADPRGDAGADADIAPAATQFQVTIRNISDRTGTPTPIAPGAWAVHSTDHGLFRVSQSASEGLERLAEDGGGGALAESVRQDEGVASAASFDGDTIEPGESTSFTFAAEPEDGGLSVASMFYQTNDIFVGPSNGPIPLFEDGQPLEARNVTGRLAWFDAGTERNQAPWMGPNQPPRQEEPNTGPPEGGIAEFDDGTRTMPQGGGLVDVSVSESDGEYTITIENVAARAGAMSTPISGIFWSTHDESWSFFLPDEQASTALESLAEDGSPSELVEANQGADGIGEVAAQTETTDGESGEAATGDSFELTVTPNQEFRKFSFATMVVESNDAFLALRNGGVNLLDEEGQPREASTIQAEIARRIALWDAGTERNEVPGVGPNQLPRQAEPNTGPEDPQDFVRLYTDATNDLAGEQVGGFLDLSITHADGPREFRLTLENTSGETVYPGRLSPLAFVTHDQSVSLFDPGTEASAALETLAETGDAAPLVSTLTGPSYGMMGVRQRRAEGGTGPLRPGESYEFTVSPTNEHRFLSIASMVIPSNDTFVALDPSGIPLLDQEGNRRSESAIASDVDLMMRAWDAGTEANQAGAAGPDQAPRQESPDSGPEEGSGRVREVSDPVWYYPAVSDVLRVRVEPVE